jgi:hypothetical protein
MKSREKLEIAMPGSSSWMPYDMQGVKGLDDDTLLDINTPPYYKYKPESELESANMILYWERSIITKKRVQQA